MKLNEEVTEIGGKTYIFMLQEVSGIWNQDYVAECDQFITDGHFQKFQCLKACSVKNERLDVMVCFMIYYEWYH